MLGHPAGVGERPSQQHLHLCVNAAELVVGPTHQGVLHRRVDPEEYLATAGHEYREPTFTTGDGG
jgi:hypothetical protein